MPAPVTISREHPHGIPARAGTPPQKRSRPIAHPLGGAVTSTTATASPATRHAEGGTLAVLDFLGNPRPHDTLRKAIQQAAEDRGYTLVHLRGGDDASAFRDELSQVYAEGINGALLVHPPGHLAGHITGHVTGHPPLTVIGPGADWPGPAVAVDDALGAHSAVCALLELGHTTVHHVSGPAASPLARERLYGWQAALRRHQRVVPPVHQGDWTSLSGYRIGLNLVDDPTVTAVLCANDDMALGLMHAFRENGRSVPQHVSVIGFDDTPAAALQHPALSSVRHNSTALGRAAVNLLIARISHPNDVLSQTFLRLQPRLVHRASTAAPLAPATTRHHQALSPRDRHERHNPDPVAQAPARQPTAASDRRLLPGA